MKGLDLDLDGLEDEEEEDEEDTPEALLWGGEVCLGCKAPLKFRSTEAAGT